MAALLVMAGCTTATARHQPPPGAASAVTPKSSAWEQVWDGAVSAALQHGTLDDVARATASMWWAAQGATAFAGEPYSSLRQRWKGEECQKYADGKTHRFDRGTSHVDRLLWSEASDTATTMRARGILKQADVGPFTQRVASYMGYATLFNEPPACVCDPMAVARIRTICQGNYSIVAERYLKALQ